MAEWKAEGIYPYCYSYHCDYGRNRKYRPMIYIAQVGVKVTNMFIRLVDINAEHILQIAFKNMLNKYSDEFAK